MSTASPDDSSSSRQRVQGLGSNHLAQVAAVAILLLSVPVPSPAATPGTTPSPPPGAWAAYNLVVKLDNLPKHYSCEALEGKFRDVLLVLGARPENILASRCEGSLGPYARSPEVHLRFALPANVHDSKEAGPGGTVAHKTIKLQPGYPSSLDASDCILLQQMKTALLAVIPVEVVGYRLPCAAPGSAKPQFEVSVSVSVPTAMSASLRQPYQ